MLPSYELQPNVGVRGDREPMGLSIIIDHIENHIVTTLNCNNGPRPGLELAPVVTIQIDVNCEGVSRSGHT